MTKNTKWLLILAGLAAGGVMLKRRSDAAARAQATGAAKSLVNPNDISAMQQAAQQLSEPAGTTTSTAGSLSGTGFDRHTLRSYGGRGSLG